MPKGNEYEWCDLRVHSLWSDLSPEHYIGAVGQLVRPQEMSADIPILDGLADSDTADGMAVKATVDQLRKIFDIVRLDDLERNVESLCLKLLLQQQPVARDLRQVSTALKMITDIKRIGDQASDVAEIIGFLNGRKA